MPRVWATRCRLGGPSGSPDGVRARRGVGRDRACRAAAFWAPTSSACSRPFSSSGRIPPDGGSRRFDRRRHRRSPPRRTGETRSRPGTGCRGTPPILNARLAALYGLAAPACPRLREASTGVAATTWCCSIGRRFHPSVFGSVAATHGCRNRSPAGASTMAWLRSCRFKSTSRSALFPTTRALRVKSAVVRAARPPAWMADPCSRSGATVGALTRAAWRRPARRELAGTAIRMQINTCTAFSS
jgi:hypothetical protein